MAATTRIGILGDFNAENPTHLATNTSLHYAAESLGSPVDIAWFPADQPHFYELFQGFICSPGSPYRSLEGALAGIRFARQTNTLRLGACGGFQHIVLEYARNATDFTHASHEESDPNASCLFITRLACSLVGKTMDVSLKPSSAAAKACGNTRTAERFYCNFGLNPDYQEKLVTSGLKITAWDQNNETRIVELPSHPFFLGTLFVPQARSEPGRPHPLLVAFLRAAARHHRTAAAQHAR